MVTSLAEQAREVRAGEILVAAYTSPAWTPLFSLVAGIVLEHGGMLSHGAVVARECGIPCVAQVRERARAAIHAVQGFGIRIGQARG